MKKNILVTSIFISLVLNCLAQEQLAEYYAMKYFPYSPYGITTKQLENYLKNDPDFVIDTTQQPKHILFRFSSTKVPTTVSGAESLSVFLSKTKLIRNKDTFPMLSYEVLYFFPDLMQLEEIKRQINTIKSDFRKKYHHCIEIWTKQTKPKSKILVVRNQQYSTGDVSVAEGFLKNKPQKYYLSISILLIPQEMISSSAGVFTNLFYK
jgi:hypothetical protein